MKKCSQCGKENDNNLAFCVQCGASFADSPFGFQQNYGSQSGANYNSYDNAQNFGQFSNTNVPKSNNNLLIWLGVAFGAILLVGLIGVIGIVAFLTPTSTRIEPVRSVSVNSNNDDNSNDTTRKSFDAPTIPTKQGSFTIDADEGWQLSDIDVVPNENFKTTANGKIGLNGIENSVTTNGVDGGKSRRIYPEFPTGALLMRTRYANGGFSNIVAVTTNGANGFWVNRPDERGKIEFTINDNAPQDNNGQFTISVRMVNVPKSSK